MPDPKKGHTSNFRQATIGGLEGALGAYREKELLVVFCWSWLVFGFLINAMRTPNVQPFERYIVCAKRKRKRKRQRKRKRERERETMFDGGPVQGYIPQIGNTWSWEGLAWWTGLGL